MYVMFTCDENTKITAVQTANLEKWPLAVRFADTEELVIYFTLAGLETLRGLLTLEATCQAPMLIESGS